MNDEDSLTDCPFVDFFSFFNFLILDSFGGKIKGDYFESTQWYSTITIFMYVNQ